MADGSSVDNFSLLVGGLAAFFTALAALITGAARGRWFSSAAPPQPPAEQRWFFDGPLAVAVNLLRDHRNHLGRLVEILDALPEETRKQTELLREIKEAQIAQKNDISDIKREIENLPSRRTGRR
jgi:hypothetical protein